MEKFRTGTIMLLALVCCLSARAQQMEAGALVRGDSSQRHVFLVFTADTQAEGLPFIVHMLQKKHVKGSFFFTGNFYGERRNRKRIGRLRRAGHYLSYHSDKHLLYCDWNQRAHLLVKEDSFYHDMEQVKRKAARCGVDTSAVHYFIPPYEWWNDSIALWSRNLGLQLVNFTPGIGLNADYTDPGMGLKYVSNAQLWQRLRNFETSRQAGLNGTILLIHVGTGPLRKEKWYRELEAVIDWLHAKGYELKRIDQINNEQNVPTNR